jgi:hypothetical protein
LTLIMRGKRRVIHRQTANTEMLKKKTKDSCKRRLSHKVRKKNHT